MDPHASTKEDANARIGLILSKCFRESSQSEVEAIKRDFLTCVGVLSECEARTQIEAIIRDGYVACCSHDQQVAFTTHLRHTFRLHDKSSILATPEAMVCAVRIALMRIPTSELHQVQRLRDKTTAFFSDMEVRRAKEVVVPMQKRSGGD